MTDREFKIGDIVELKSGGPKMTINRIIGKDTPSKDQALKDHYLGYSNGQFVCVWYDFSQEEYKEQIFSPESLIKSTDS